MANQYLSNTRFGISAAAAQRVRPFALGHQAHGLGSIAVIEPPSLHQRERPELEVQVTISYAPPIHCRTADSRYGTIAAG
jgi:hypothetical protein